jgi:hypothetical protein
MSYQGGSVFLRLWPIAMLALALAAFGFGGMHAIQWPTLLVVAAYVHTRWMPWQFTIQEDGLELAFPLGRRLFLPKASLTVRMEAVGATALVGRHRRFGYLLLDRITPEPGRTELIETAFTGLGYTLREQR